MAGKHWIWEDHDGAIHLVVRTGEVVPHYFGQNYVSIKTVDEQCYHSAIVHESALLPAGNDIH
jgi:hypothetical protein